jgi:hypothetical protein
MVRVELCLDGYELCLDGYGDVNGDGYIDNDDAARAAILVPAVEYTGGELHRLDGPAEEWADGDKEWYIYGDKLSERCFNNHRLVKDFNIMKNYTETKSPYREKISITIENKVCRLYWLWFIPSSYFKVSIDGIIFLVKESSKYTFIIQGDKPKTVIRNKYVQIKEKNINDQIINEVCKFITINKKQKELRRNSRWKNFLMFFLKKGSPKIDLTE